jgi:hypothetical protein
MTSVASLAKARGEKLCRELIRLHREEQFRRRSHPAYGMFMECVEGVVGVVNPQNRRAVRRVLAEFDLIPDCLRGNRPAYEKWIDTVIEESEREIRAMIEIRKDRLKTR